MCSNEVMSSSFENNALNVTLGSKCEDKVNLISFINWLM